MARAEKYPHAERAAMEVAMNVCTVASQFYRAALGHDPLCDVEEEVETAWRRFAPTEQSELDGDLVFHDAPRTGHFQINVPVSKTVVKCEREDEVGFLFRFYCGWEIDGRVDITVTLRRETHDGAQRYRAHEANIRYVDGNGSVVEDAKRVILNESRLGILYQRFRWTLALAPESLAAA